VDTEPHWSNRQHSGRLGSQAGLHSSPVLRSDRPGFGEGSDPEDRATGVPYLLPSRSTLSHTPHPYWRGQSAVPLETRLVQLTCKHAPPPTTPTHDAWWDSWRWLGRRHAHAPWPGMRETAEMLELATRSREKECVVFETVRKSIPNKQ